MQSRSFSKILVSFFTVFLIIYSLYELSFTWLIKRHENKLEAKAEKVLAAYPTPVQKYPNDKALQAAYEDTLKDLVKARLTRLKDSTKDVTLSYGPGGKISYSEAKENELNLGLDLQGGVNVTLEVELVGLLKSLSNNSKDPNFLKALENANLRKANSNANFITLFVEEYNKVTNNTGRLASIFATPNQEKIKINDDNSKVESVLRKEASDAFDRTFRILRTRIDQFGVAQPNINPDAAKGIINVELPGVQDQERVRRLLQSSANLQFWEVYSLADLVKDGSFTKASDAFKTMMGGEVKQDTAATKIDSTGTKADSGKITEISQLGGGTQNTTTNDKGRVNITDWIQFNAIQGQPADVGAIGYVKSNDTAIVRTYLENPAVLNQLPGDLKWMYGMPESAEQKKIGAIPLYAIKTNGRENSRLEGDVITDAKQDYDNNGKIAVSMSMSNRGAKIWADMTKANIGKSIAIALDNLVYSAPRVNQEIDGGNSSISGGFEKEVEGQDLANILKAGKVPAPAKIVQEQTVGPTLGQDAIRGGSLAFLISFVVIFTLMLLYYNTSGWVANIALILNLLFTVGVLIGLGFTLTAAGIAGLVLTIGMAVDTNVIIYERIKEELTKGKGYVPAVNEGYRRSLPPVLDAHVTTLLTAIILFYFGLGPVRGFATTQIIGILLSLFCGILVSRWVSDWFTNKKRHLEYFTGVSRRIFKHAKYKFIEYRKVAYGISFVVLALGIASFFNGFDEGVEFKGGRSYQVRFETNTSGNVETIRKDLEKAFGEAPIIKTVGDSRTLDITTSYLINATSQNADSLVEAKLYEGLKPHFKNGLSYAKFAHPDNNIGKIGSKKVLPTISDDLKAGAVKATIFAILIIFLYIFIRFRDWRYSLGTIIALLHDVFVTLIVFSFARTIVPFPLEIDQHFIAAILTVIGFSMNDTVIVFDRIREDRKLYPTAPLGDTINRAINETLSRTIMTSLTVFLTILILFIVGGEVTRGFAFAMLVGVITGTYSSVFVAAPILVDLGRKKEKPTTVKTTETKA